MNLAPVVLGLNTKNAMENKFEVKIESFTGPLDLLLKLIEEKKLEIDKINISNLVDDYLNYFQNFQDKIPLEELSDYLLIFAKLLLLKSAVLSKIQIQEEDLVVKLEYFVQVKEAREVLRKFLKNSNTMHERESFLRFFAPPQISLKELEISLNSILNIPIEIQKIEFKEIIKIQEAIERTLKILNEIPEIEFSQIVGSNKNDQNFKKIVIAYFLAILTIWKERKIEVEQNELFGKIFIKKSE